MGPHSAQLIAQSLTIFSEHLFGKPTNKGKTKLLRITLNPKPTFRTSALPNPPYLKQSFSLDPEIPDPEPKVLKYLNPKRFRV